MLNKLTMTLNMPHAHLSHVIRGAMMAQDLTPVWVHQQQLPGRTEAAHHLHKNRAIASMLSINNTIVKVASLNSVICKVPIISKLFAV
jgi:hypothetical protein